MSFLGHQRLMREARELNETIEELKAKLKASEEEKEKMAAAIRKIVDDYEKTKAGP